MVKKIGKKIDKMNKDVEKPLKVRFCPECRSTDVQFVFRIKNLFGLLPKVECTRCGYRNVDFPILVVKPSDLKKKVAKMKKAAKAKKVLTPKGVPPGQMPSAKADKVGKKVRRAKK